MFRANVLLIRRSELHYTASGIITPIGDEHMCSKHIEAWNKLIVKQKFCASSWLITEINILRCTVSKKSKFNNWKLCGRICLSLGAKYFVAQCLTRLSLVKCNIRERVTLIFVGMQDMRSVGLIRCLIHRCAIVIKDEGNKHGVHQFLPHRVCYIFWTLTSW